MLFYDFPTAVTIRTMKCRYKGSAPIQQANFSLADGNGNAMTLSATPTCAGPTASTTAVNVTAGNTLTAGELLVWSVGNIPDPDGTQTYMLCVTYDKN